MTKNILTATAALALLAFGPLANAKQNCDTPSGYFAAPGYAPAYYGPRFAHRPWNMPWFGPRQFGFAPRPYGYAPVTAAPAIAPVQIAPAQSDCPPKAEVTNNDDDQDGVLNTADLCPETATGVAVDVFGCAASAPIVLKGVNFELNSDKLTVESYYILNRVSETLLAHPELSLEVAGHTDSQGDDQYNLDLSQRRSEAVRKYLVSKGINGDKLQSKGYGESQPIADNGSKVGRAENRRVELSRIDG